MLSGLGSVLRGTLKNNKETCKLVLFEPRRVVVDRLGLSAAACQYKPGPPTIIISLPLDSTQNFLVENLRAGMFPPIAICERKVMVDRILVPA